MYLYCRVTIRKWNQTTCRLFHWSYEERDKWCLEILMKFMNSTIGIFHYTVLIKKFHCCEDHNMFVIMMFCYSVFLQELEKYHNSPEEVGQCFLKNLCAYFSNISTCYTCTYFCCRVKVSDYMKLTVKIVANLILSCKMILSVKHSSK